MLKPILFSSKIPFQNSRLFFEISGFSVALFCSTLDPYTSGTPTPILTSCRSRLQWDAKQVDPDRLDSTIPGRRRCGYIDGYSKINDWIWLICLKTHLIFYERTNLSLFVGYSPTVYVYMTYLSPGIWHWWQNHNFQPGIRHGQGNFRLPAKLFVPVLSNRKRLSPTWIKEKQWNKIGLPISEQIFESLHAPSLRHTKMT